MLFINVSYAQINIRVKNYNNYKASLYSLEGENISFIDSLNSDKQGNFQFNLDNNHVGFYRLNFTKTKWLDFIYDNENIEIETDANSIYDSLKIIQSKSNKIFHTFIKLNIDYKTKTELLQLILARYPKGDHYHQFTKEKIIQVQEDYLYFVNVNSQANPNSFIARYVRTAQLPVVEVEISGDEQLIYLKAHSLDNVDFYDDGLIYSDAFTNKTIEYLSYYRNPQLPKELLEKEFMICDSFFLSITNEYF